MIKIKRHALVNAGARDRLAVPLNHLAFDGLGRSRATRRRFLRHLVPFLRYALESSSRIVSTSCSSAIISSNLRIRRGRLSTLILAHASKYRTYSGAKFLNWNFRLQRCSTRASHDILRARVDRIGIEALDLLHAVDAHQGATANLAALAFFSNDDPCREGIAFAVIPFLADQATAAL